MRFQKAFSHKLGISQNDVPKKFQAVLKKKDGYIEYWFLYFHSTYLWLHMF